MVSYEWLQEKKKGQFKTSLRICGEKWVLLPVSRIEYR